VALAPGAAFGRGGEGAVRICCAADESILEPAMERLARFIESGQRGWGRRSHPSEGGRSYCAVRGMMVQAAAQRDPGRPPPSAVPKVDARR
jgi:hypothetical protein